MIHLERVVLREIHLPLSEPFRTVHGEVSIRRILLLELVDETGTAVWAECVAQAEPGYSPETVDGCWAAIVGSLASRVLGKDIDSPGDATAILGVGTETAPMARAAVEMGIWGLFSVIENRSLARFLAAASRDGHQPRTHVETGVAIGMQRSEGALVARARQAVAEGYRRIKVKIDPSDAVATIGVVREAIGPAFPLSADANGSFRMDDPAHLAVLETLDGFGLVMIEQPLAPGDLRGHGALQRMIRTPICLDESIVDLAEAQRMHWLGAGRVVNLKPGRVGGLGEALAIHDFAMHAGLPLWCGGMLECGIGRAYNVALASLRGFSDPGELSPSSRYWTRDVVTPAWTMDVHGRVEVPLDRPGLGVEVDAGFIDDCTVRRVVVSAA